MPHHRSLVPILLFLLAVAAGAATPRQLFLVNQPAVTLTNHHGDLLTGNYSVNLLWYGRFTPAQRAVLADFILSLSVPGAPPPGSVAAWWATTARYHPGAARLSLGRQVLLDNPSKSLGRRRRLSESSLASLAARYLGPHRRTVAVVVTGPDVVVDGFCVSRCGLHAASSSTTTTTTAAANATGEHHGHRGRGRFAWAWVGNAAEQCPGECAWPFHAPPYGPSPSSPVPLVAPNADVGMDGTVVTVAAVLAGAVTNPYGGGFFQGPAEAPLEAVSACAGVFGAGAYPGYPGLVRVDAATGAAYNAVGVSGRRFLLPAMWDPHTAQCSTPAV